MGRLIDADRLKAHYCWWSGGTKEMTIDEAKKTFDTIIDVQPTVDAVEVVRCKDCFICETRQTANYLPFLYCELHDCSVLGDFFCSWGERKDDAKEE